MRHETVHGLGQTAPDMDDHNYPLHALNSPTQHREQPLTPKNENRPWGFKEFLYFTAGMALAAFSIYTVSIGDFGTPWLKFGAYAVSLLFYLTGRP